MENPRRLSSIQPLTLNPEPKSITTPLPSLGNNATLEKIDAVIDYSYTCIDNGEVVGYIGWSVGGTLGIII